MTRIHNDTVDIDPDEVRLFFDERAASMDAMQATMLQASGSDLPFRRDRHERETITPRLALGTESRLLDLGCGSGRWASVITEPAQRYCGVDFSPRLIALAQSHHADRPDLRFQCADVATLDPAALLLPPPFTHIISTGLFVYMNDAQVTRTLQTIPRLASARATVYLRESMAVTDDRLTLRAYASEELGTTYSAIYRSPEQYRQMLEISLLREGFHITDQGRLLPPELRNRAETDQMFFLLER